MMVYLGNTRMVIIRVYLSGLRLTTAKGVDPFFVFCVFLLLGCAWFWRDDAGVGMKI